MKQESTAPEGLHANDPVNVVDGKVVTTPFGSWAEAHKGET